MENIFKDAKFGDKYRTRDGRIAIYLGDNRFDCGEVYVVHKGRTHSTRLMKDGHYWATPNVETDDDVVGKLEEPIDEEALENLAQKSESQQFQLVKQGLLIGQCIDMDFIAGFKAGFMEGQQKSMEEGYQQAVDKACKWLLRNRRNYNYINVEGDVYTLSLIEDFKKYMEE